MNTPEYKQIDITLIDPSKTNARKKFRDLDELAVSIKEKGVLEPLLVRPKGKRFEIVAGERRYRSAKLAELAKLPCLVRKMDDQDAVECQAIENAQRSDLEPLEQATSYRQLIDTKPDKHSATTIAAKIGKSPSWVWDVMKILDMIPPAKKLLEQERMTLNHAIPIARLTKEQQEAVIHPEDGGLFEYEKAYGLDFDGEDEEETGDPYRGLKTRTVRELNAWIAKYIRFDVKQAAKAAPLEFEAVAETVKNAEEEPGRGKKVIPITYNTFVAPDAKDPDGERTYGPTSWMRADGKEDSKECEHSVLGYIAVGPEYGSAFRVCIAREKCQVHWGKVIKQKARRQKDQASGKAVSAQSEQKKYEEQQRKEQEKRQQAQDRWEVVCPALEKAMKAKLADLPGTLPTHLLQKLVKELELPRNTNQRDLATAMVAKLANNRISQGRGHWYEYGEKRMVEWANALGVDVKACEPKPEKAPTKAKPSKKPAPKK